MTTKLLSLLLTIGATALTQMANACAGAEPDGPAEPPAKPAKGPKAAKAPPAPEPEEEEETEVTVETEEEDDGVDYDALRASAKASLVKLFSSRPELKDKVRAALHKLAPSIPDLPDEKVQPFIDAVKKIAAGK